MLFIIPVKSSAISPSWQRFVKLFERCVRSVCQQTDQDFKVVVVCHEIPEIEFKHPNIYYHQVDFPPPITEKESGIKLTNSPREADKAKKILAGIEFGSQFNYSHAMVVDADDCISNHLVSFVKKNSAEPGWYFYSGYIYKEGSGFIYKKLKGFNGICGTCLIVKTAHLKEVVTADLYFRHSKTKLDTGIRLKMLPFIGSIYTINNGENHFMTENTIKYLKSGATLRKNSYSDKIIRLMQKAFTYRIWFVTNSVKSKFGLYKIA